MATKTPITSATDAVGLRAVEEHGVAGIDTAVHAEQSHGLGAFGGGATQH